MDLFRRSCTSFLLLALSAAVALADGPTTAPAPAELKAAFAKLASDDATERDNAQEQIVQMGPAIAEPLKALIATASDIEQRTGAQAALARIQQVAQVGATLISLKLDNVTPNQAFAELARKSGYPIRSGGGEDNRRISVNLENKPFWSVMNEICTKAGYSIQNQGNNQISVSQGTGYLSGPAWVDGPFMIVARQINLSSNVQLVQRNASNKNMYISFMCLVEPKLQISQRPYNVTLTECVDDKDQSLVAGGNNGMPFFDGGMGEGGAQIMWDSNAQLKVPENPSSKITQLKGNVRLMAAVKNETLEIDDVLTAKNVTKSAAGYTLTVKNATQNGEQTSVSMTLAFPPNRRNAYQLLQQVKLLDASGNPMPQQGTNGPSGGNNRFDYRVTYGRNGGEDKATKPAKVVLTVPTETKPLDFNFEFKDLPLPK